MPEKEPSVVLWAGLCGHMSHFFTGFPEVKGRLPSGLLTSGSVVGCHAGAAGRPWFSLRNCSVGGRLS